MKIRYGLDNICEVETAVHISPEGGSVGYRFQYPFKEKEGEVIFHSEGYSVIPRGGIDLVLHSSLNTFPDGIYRLAASRITVEEYTKRTNMLRG